MIQSQSGQLHKATTINNRHVEPPSINQHQHHNHNPNLNSKHQSLTSTTMKISNTAVLLLTALFTPSAAFAPPSTHQTRAAAPSSSSSSSIVLSAVSKKDVYQITLLPGDGIGPEIMSSTKTVLSALQRRCGFTLEMIEPLIGGAAIDERGEPFPDESLEQCLKSDSVLLSCIGGYKVNIII